MTIHSQVESAEHGPLPRTIDDVPGIMNGWGRTFRRREEIRAYVESPLVRAVEELYDKNIETVESSANAGHLNPQSGELFFEIAWLDLNNRSLSAENRARALALGGTILPDEERTPLRLTSPLRSGMSVAGIEEAFLAYARALDIQEPMWFPHLTRAEVIDRIAYTNPLREEAELRDDEIMMGGATYTRNDRLYEGAKILDAARELIRANGSDEELIILMDRVRTTVRNAGVHLAPFNPTGTSVVDEHIPGFGQERASAWILMLRRLMTLPNEELARMSNTILEPDGYFSLSDEHIQKRRAWNEGRAMWIPPTQE